jgi:hypothetical protein
LFSWKERDIFVVERERDVRGLFFRSSAAARPIKTLRALLLYLLLYSVSLSLFLSLKLSLSPFDVVSLAKISL